MNLIRKQIGSISLEVCEELEPGISFTDFCCPSGTIEFNAYDGFLTRDILLFSFSYKDFIFQSKIKDGMVFVRRNNLYQHSEQVLDLTGCSAVAIQWDIESIGCGVKCPNSDKDINYHIRSVRTPLTTPSREIVQLLRKNNLLDNESYRSINDLFMTVIDCLSLCESEIRRYGAERLFWKKDGGKYFPIREPDITTGVAPFLSSYGATRNFDVVCESVVGSGRIDFYITAPVVDLGIGKIAIEAKKADSNDLTDGLSKQLPEYMERLKTSFGILLVYWMKSFDYLYPSAGSYPLLEIEKLHPIQRATFIRTICLDLSRSNSSSQL